MKKFLYFIFDITYTVFACTGLIFTFIWAICMSIKFYNIGYIPDEDKGICMLCVCILGTWCSAYRKNHKGFLTFTTKV